MADDIVIPTVDFKFTGIERIVYGVQDLELGKRFFQKNWQPQNWPRTNENYAEWAIAGGIDAATRRQVGG